MANPLRADFTPSANVARLRESATIAVSARARALRAAGRAVIDLGAGEPDFDTPEFIRRAAQRAIDEGATRYTATEGIAPLRHAIASLATVALRSGAGGAVAPEDVVVSTGSKQALFNACFVLFAPGDEVLIPTPAWTSYYEIVALARATAVAVDGDPDDALKVRPAHLAAAATQHTRGVIINSPCNPTGAVYSADELRAILALAAERGWWVVSDEIYRRITYGTRAPSTLETAEWPGRLVVIDGVAKTYAMTGWRIGWAIAPREVARAMTALQSHTTSNASSVAQHAALAALTARDAGDAAVARMVAAFRERRDAALATLRGEPRLPCVPPEGAFYLYVDAAAVARADPDAEPGSALARHLLERYDVAAVPGAAFGSPRWLRLSYAAPLDQVIAGAQRLVAAFRDLT